MAYKINAGTVNPLKQMGDARGTILRTKEKLKVGGIYTLPLQYVSMKSDTHPKMRCICTGKYKYFATFENYKGIPQSFTYYDLATMGTV